MPKPSSPGGNWPRAARCQRMSERTRSITPPGTGGGGATPMDAASYARAVDVADPCSLPPVRTGRFRRRERHVARYAWPAGVGAAGAGWYAADSLRHRRESGHGYRLRGEVDVAEASFLRAAESITGAPVSFGNDADLLINGDRIFPAYVEAIRAAEE